MSHSRELERLIAALEAGALGRREFLRRTAALGLGVAASSSWLHARQEGWGGKASEPAEGIAYRESHSTANWLSHPPHRALPSPSQRPFDPSSRDFYLAPDGDDARGNGSEARPWRSWRRARTALRPGDTLYMRGGVYFMYGGLDFTTSGTARRPITIRAYPNELPIVTAALPELYHDPHTAWEPVPLGEGGVAEEYRGFENYDLSSHRQNTVAGIFPDSFIPLMRPSKLTDFRSQNEYYLDGAPDHPSGLWLGPCAQWNSTDHKIHVRLSHTNRDWLDHTDYLGQGASFTTNNYKGVTDPREIPLLICPWRNDRAMLKLAGSHLRILDIVFCATYGAECSGSSIVYDGVSYFANEHSFYSFGSDIRFTNCKLRGIATPWSGRFLDKYHVTSPYLVSFDGGTNIEIDHSEVTDTHDGILFSSTVQQNVDFHHNLVSNCNDDGIWMVPRQNAIKRIYQNHFQMVLSQLPFRDGPHVAKENPGEGTFVYRNLFDLRPLIPNNAPPASDPTARGVYREPNNLVMEHADFVQYPGFYFYHNTVLVRRSPSGNFYGCGTVRNFAHSIRRVYNNIFFHLEGGIPDAIPDQEGDLAYGHNLMWSMGRIAPSKAPQDVHANPEFVAFSHDWRDPHDLHLKDSSPCRGAGIAIPAAWPDPLRDQETDPSHPDIGAVPHGFAGTVWGPSADIRAMP